MRRVHSHAVALGQVRDVLRELGAAAVVQADTAGSAAMVAEWGRPEDAAVASRLAAEIYGLDVLRANVEDAAHNTTRFYIAAREPRLPPPGTPGLMTTFVFRVRNVPAPKIARDYWRLADDATLRDVVLAVRADEAGHRDVNHGFADTLRPV